MGMLRSIILLTTLSAVLSSPAPTTEQPFHDASILNLLTNQSSSLETTLPAASNRSLSTDFVVKDSHVHCNVQPPMPRPQFRPIVLEDCYPLFAAIFLSPTFITPITYTPRSTGWRLQNGNCVLTMSAGPDAVAQEFREIQLGVFLARILGLCVRAETGYLGGERKMTVAGTLSDWIVRIYADGPRVR